MNRQRCSHNVIIALTAAIFICTGAASVPAADLSLTPDKAVLSPALLKAPIKVQSAGWKPGEMVVVNLLIPPNVKVKGAKPGEDVGIASGNADEKGALNAVIGPLTVLMTFFQAEWDDAAMKPDMSKASPLPPGTYKVQAIGLESDVKTEASLTLLAPEKK